MLEFQQEKFGDSFLVWGGISLKGYMPAQALIFMWKSGGDLVILPVIETFSNFLKKETGQAVSCELVKFPII